MGNMWKWIMVKQNSYYMWAKHTLYFSLKVGGTYSNHYSL